MAQPDAMVQPDAMAQPDAMVQPDAGPSNDGTFCDELAALPTLRAGALPQALAARGPLPRAICSCLGLVAGAEGPLLTDAWNGALGPYASDRVTGGGDVALNLELNLQARGTIGGALIAAGSDGVSLFTGIELEVGSDLGVGGSLRGNGASVRVGGNAAVAGSIDLAELRIAGTLTQPGGKPFAVSSPPELGALANAPVAIDPPCGCSEAELLDIAALVQGELPATTPVGELECPGASANGAVALYATERLHVTSDLRLGTGPGPDLVLIVDGDLLIEGRLELGNPELHRRVRLYVGGTGTIELRAGGSLSGELYAPNAELVLEGPLTVYGALFLKRVAAQSALTVHQEVRR
jgi:hypothetical protein